MALTCIATSSSAKSMEIVSMLHGIRMDSCRWQPQRFETSSLRVNLLPHATTIVDQVSRLSCKLRARRISSARCLQRDLVCPCTPVAPCAEFASTAASRTCATCWPPCCRSPRLRCRTTPAPRSCAPVRPALTCRSNSMFGAPVGERGSVVILRRFDTFLCDGKANTAAPWC